MTSLPDLEGLAVFAKVAEARSFAGAAAELHLAKATVSKAIARLEARLGTRLVNRSARRFALTPAGEALVERAARILAEAEAAEGEALAQSTTPRGRVRLAAPMSFGLRAVAPLLAGFLARYPEIELDLHLSDAVIDLVGDGFDAALRIAALPDSALRARRLRTIERHTVAAPSYLARHGRPTHPLHLAEHRCLGYAYLATADAWRFVNADGETASVRPGGPLRANNGDALMPALLAGLGIAVLPDFIVGEALADGRLVPVMPDWSPPPTALHLLTPPGGPRPARVAALLDDLSRHLVSGGLHKSK